MKGYCIGVLTVAWLLQPLGAVGQTPLSGASAAQKTLDTVAAAQGLIRLQPVRVDSIGEDEYAEFAFDVPVDVNVVVRAACNSSCHDIDLKVFDAAGADLGDTSSNETANASPQLTLAAGRHAARIKVMAVLQSCADETCSIAVGVYKR